MAENDLNRVVQGTLLGDALVNAQVAALLADDDGYYVAVNDQACTLTGYSRTRLTGFRAGELAADDASRRIYQKLSSGSKLRGRKLVRRKDGQIVACHYWGIPTDVGKLPYFILLLWPTGRSGTGRGPSARRRGGTAAGTHRAREA